MKAKSILIVFATITLFYSCSKEKISENKFVSESSLKSSSTIQSNYCPYNILVFENDQKLSETVNTLKVKSDAEFASWELQNNFVSMYTAFNKIVDDELNYSESTVNEHSILLYEYPNAFISVLTDDSCGFYDINNDLDNQLSKVINPDGLVVVGGKIYMYSKEKIKIINDGDFSKIPQLYTIASTNQSLGIIVEAAASSGTNSFHRECNNKNNPLKIIVYEDFVQNISSTYPNQRVTFYAITVRSLKRRLWGAWYDNYKTNINLQGNHNGNTTYGWLANGSSVYIGWYGSYNVNSNGMQHTLKIYLPYNSMPQTYPGPNLRTDGNHPQIYSSWHQGTISRDGKSVSCTTTYP